MRVARKRAHGRAQACGGIRRLVTTDVGEIEQRYHLFITVWLNLGKKKGWWKSGVARCQTPPQVSRKEKKPSYNVNKMDHPRASRGARPRHDLRGTVERLDR